MSASGWKRLYEDDDSVTFVNLDTGERKTVSKKPRPFSPPSNYNRPIKIEKEQTKMNWWGEGGMVEAIIFLVMLLLSFYFIMICIEKLP